MPRRVPCLRPWNEAGDYGLRVAVTTRHGGVSTGAYESLNLGLHVGDDPTRVVRNRERAANAFGVDLNDLVFAEQVHGARATVVDRDDRGRGTRDQADAVAATDILVTTSAGVVPVMLVADCLPLALVDPDAKVLATVHAGWRGTAAGVVGGAARGHEPARGDGPSAQWPSSVLPSHRTVIRSGPKCAMVWPRP